MLAAAQVAQYIGFTSYDIVGCDGYTPSFEGSQPNHFDPDYDKYLNPPNKDTGAKATSELNRRQGLAYEHIARSFFK